MSIFRKAYSVAGVVLMLQFVLQIYFIATAIFTIVNANDNAKDRSEPATRGGRPS